MEKKDIASTLKGVYIKYSYYKMKKKCLLGPAIKFLTCSCNPGNVKLFAVVNFEELLHHSSFVFPFAIYGTEQVLGIDVVVQPLIPSHSQKCEEDRYDQKIPRVFTNDESQLVKGSVEPIIDDFETHFLQQTTQ